MLKEKIRIAIAGASGRMGMQLLHAMEHHEQVQLGAVLEHKSSSLIGVDAGELIGKRKNNITIIDNLEKVIADFDILIDFTRPEGTLSYLDICTQHQKGMVIGTTGLNEQQQQKLVRASQKMKIVYSANFSIGINLVLKLLEKATRVIGHEADIEIIESHHRNKVDAPSGTALAMGDVIASTLGMSLKECATYTREGHTGIRKPNTIGFATIRAGDIVGEHTAIFASIGERIEISHKASSRMTFANGAIKAACWLIKQPKGLYDMQDVLSLHSL